MSPKKKTSKPMLDDMALFELDQIIIKHWEAKDENDKKRCVLDCYKLFKDCNYDGGVITYLITNGAKDLADEMEHFENLHDSVPHEHEERKAA